MMPMDVKPEIKSEDSEINELAQKIKASHDNLKSSSVPLQSTSITTQINQLKEIATKTSVPLVNFGWEAIPNRPLFPFVRRGSQCFVANKICRKLIFFDVYKKFSLYTTDCLPVFTQKMTQNEAYVFNEINIIHCDRSLVGDQSFHEGELMTDLQDIKQSLKFFEACENTMVYRKLQNDLFGFIKIAGKNEVPFVWSGYTKLVPLFYFEGQNEYLDSRSVNLIDKWKLAYLKFCCIVQNIRKDFYNASSLKVVDFEDVKKLFPKNTSFELCWPEECNQELLAPELRLRANSIPTAGVSPVSHFQQVSNSYVTSQANIASSGVPARHSSLNQTPNSCTVSYPCHTTHQSSKNIGNDNTAKSNLTGRKCRSTDNLKTESGKAKRRNLKDSRRNYSAARKSNTASNTREHIAMTPVTPSVSRTRTTNVPYRSPQTASSPELRLHSPLMSEAATSRQFTHENFHNNYAPMSMQSETNPVSQQYEAQTQKIITTAMSPPQVNMRIPQNSQQAAYLQSSTQRPPPEEPTNTSAEASQCSTPWLSSSSIRETPQTPVIYHHKSFSELDELFSVLNPSPNEKMPQNVSPSMCFQSVSRMPTNEVISISPNNNISSVMCHQTTAGGMQESISNNRAINEIPTVQSQLVSRVPVTPYEPAMAPSESSLSEAYTQSPAACLWKKLMKQNASMRQQIVPTFGPNVYEYSSQTIQDFNVTNVTNVVQQL